MKSKAVDVIEVKLPPKREYVGVVRLTLSGIANRMGFSYEAIEDIKIAVSEAITNAVQHAYKGDKKGVITVCFHIFENRLEIIVSDEGDSFNVEEVEKNLQPHLKSTSATISEGGLGLYLIETLMDDLIIHYENGVTLCMTKFLDGEQVERDAKAVST